MAADFVRSIVVESLTGTIDADTRMELVEAFPALNLSWDVATMPDLIKLVRLHDLPEVSCVAADRLGNLGAHAMPAVPELIELLKSRERNQATVALLALDKIGLSEPGVVDGLVFLAHEGVEGACAVLMNLVNRQRVLLCSRPDAAAHGQAIGSVEPGPLLSIDPRRGRVSSR